MYLSFLLWMASAMYSPRIDNLFSIHGICIKSCHFLWWDVGPINVPFGLLCSILPIPIKPCLRVVKLVLRIYRGSFRLKEVILSLAIVTRGRSNPAALLLLVGHEVLQLVRVVISYVDRLPVLRAVAWRHHPASHYHIAVPFAWGPVGALKIIVLNYVDRVVLMVIYLGLLPSRRSHSFSWVVVIAVLRAWHSISSSAEWPALSIVALVSCCVRMHVKLLVQICI